ncbi:MAG: M28 family peptidase [Spirochaetes bacterium]|nr:M28 family peptidase [Spirochaetota bacterium]
MTKRTLNSLTNFAFTIVKTIIDNIGPRPSCSEHSHLTARIFFYLYKAYCHSVQLQSFITHPHAFLGFLTLVPWLYIAAVIFLLIKLYIVAAFIFTLANSIAIRQFILYKATFDFLYTPQTGYNAIGMINPKKEVRQQIIISGHHDSAYEFRFMRTTPRLYRIRVASIILSMVGSLILAWLIVINRYSYNLHTVHAIFMVVIILLGILNMQMLFFKSNRATPGAGDNLIASAITVVLAKFYSNYRPHYTRLIFASFDGEECGLKGSKAFANEYKKLIGCMPTYHLNIDSLYRPELIKFLTSDVNGFVTLSEEFAKTCVATAHSKGYAASTFAMYPGTGATDAAPLAQAGARATTLIALPTEVEKQHSVYHTMNDTVENIHADVVKAAIEIVNSVTEFLDKKIKGCPQLIKDK